MPISCAALVASIAWTGGFCGADAGQVAAVAPARLTHGVASGDPDQQSVLPWTRLVTADGSAATIAWEIADDAEFIRCRPATNVTCPPAVGRIGR